MNRQIIPLSKRPGDIAIVAFFLVNILFITYIVDLEQLVIADPEPFTMPVQSTEAQVGPASNAQTRFS